MLISILIFTTILLTTSYIIADLQEVKLMKENRKVLCYDIISYMSVLVGFDVTKLGDDEIILMVEKLQELSDFSLLLLHEDLISIYKESCITEE